MTIPKHVPGAILIAAALAVSACASANPGPSGERPPERGISAEEYEELYRARLESARTRYTEADVHFMSRMIHHHAQAIEMAQLAPGRTDNPQIRTLAARIINAQNDEIAIMRRWLEDREQPIPEVGGETHDHAAMGHAEHHSTMMPGMLTPAEIRMLEQTRGDAFDRLFLTSMIRHHAGAVTMVKELFATDGAAQDEEVFKFASDAQVDQATEVDRMEAMLAQLPQTGAAR